jgi:hypothetical protein
MGWKREEEKEEQLIPLLYSWTILDSSFGKSDGRVLVRNGREMFIVQVVRVICD